MGKLKSTLLGGLAGILLATATPGRTEENQKQEITPSYLFEPTAIPEVIINQNQEFPLQSNTNQDYSLFYEIMSGAEKAVTYDPENKTRYSNAKLTELFDNIRNNKISSYNELIDNSESLSEEQKINLLSTIGNLFVNYGYNMESAKDTPVSQNEFFNRLQDMTSEEEVDLGVCIQYNSYIEKLADDMGLESSIASGNASDWIGHAITLIKTEEGTEVIDYNRRLSTDTKNIEKAIEAWQDQTGTESFHHLFFENGEFKYRLIPEQGEQILDFLEYDPTSKTLENILISGIEKNKGTEISRNRGGLIDYIGINSSGKNTGISLKIGEMNDSNLEGTNLYEGKIQITPYIKNINIRGNIGGMLGIREEDNNLYGIMGESAASTNNEEGFNIGIRSSNQVLGIETDDNLMPLASLFYDLNISAGISYRFTNDDSKITPYSALQFSYFLIKPDNNTYRFVPSEARAGINIITGDNSVRPYYIWRPWEHEIGAESQLKFEDSNLNIKIGGGITFPTYEFTPQKISYETEISREFENFDLGVNYKSEFENYDKEIEYSPSLNINISY